MAVCCQNLTLGALSSRRALSMLVGALFKKFGLVLNTPRTLAWTVRLAFCIFRHFGRSRRWKIKSLVITNNMSEGGTLHVSCVAKKRNSYRVLHGT